jgi:hypothetical protein
VDAADAQPPARLPPQYLRDREDDVLGPVRPAETPSSNRTRARPQTQQKISGRLRSEQATRHYTHPGRSQQKPRPPQGPSAHGSAPVISQAPEDARPPRPAWAERSCRFYCVRTAIRRRQSTFAHTGMSRRMRLLLTLCNSSLSGSAQVAA